MLEDNVYTAQTKLRISHQIRSITKSIVYTQSYTNIQSISRYEQSKTHYLSQKPQVHTSLANKYDHPCARRYLLYNINSDQDITSNFDLSQNLLNSLRATKIKIHSIYMSNQIYMTESKATTRTYSLEK